MSIDVPRSTPSFERGFDAVASAPLIPGPSDGVPNIYKPLLAILKKSPTDKPCG